MEIERVATMWVVWGVGSPLPERFAHAEVRDEAARIAQERDPGWSEDPDGWAVVVTATVDELERFAATAGSFRGSAPYEAGVEARGGDEGPRSTVEEARPY